jgi:hypothetical protein
MLWVASGRKERVRALLLVLALYPRYPFNEAFELLLSHALAHEAQPFGDLLL